MRTLIPVSNKEGSVSQTNPRCCRQHVTDLLDSPGTGSNGPVPQFFMATPLLEGGQNEYLNEP